MSALYPDDESIERALFERRVGAMPNAGIPSLDAVLRAAGSEPRDASDGGGRSRAWAGLALAAACLLAILKARPSDVPHATIAPDLGASRSSQLTPGSEVCQDFTVGGESECSLDTTCVSIAPPPPVAHDDGLCSSAPASFASNASLSCGEDDVLRSEIR